jgi:hypothetical protein
MDTLDGLDEEDLSAGDPEATCPPLPRGLRALRRLRLRGIGKGSIFFLAAIRQRISLAADRVVQGVAQEMGGSAERVGIKFGKNLIY